MMPCASGSCNSGILDLNLFLGAGHYGARNTTTLCVPRCLAFCIMAGHDGNLFEDDETRRPASFAGLHLISDLCEFHLGSSSQSESPQPRIVQPLIRSSDVRMCKLAASCQ